MPQEKYVAELVGGPSDGQTYEVPYPRDTLLVPVSPKERLLEDCDILAVEFQEAIYHRREHDDRMLYHYDFKGFV